MIALTAIVALGTLGLWLATRDLVLEAQRTSERQAREMRESLSIGERTVATMEKTA
jgi:hypothetical protein